MDVDTVWRTIDAERAGLADLVEDLSPAEWDTPSLCAGWRVGDVAVHLTQAHMGLRDAAVAAVRARGSFDRMIRDSALRARGLTPEECARRLRAMVGSRRMAPFLTPVQPLIDVLVHGQDIALPLSRSRPMPPAAAAAAAQAVWATSFPFRARRKLAGYRLTADDADLVLGDGAPVHGPASAVLLLVTGRTTAAAAHLAGDGAHRLVS
ncbi:maleylpyruvate isomerase family mycothiol-dependent enzyme [Blastococcus sp. URHD0036]|uniref:maleylpyruvate isomerase family mycothiol-dependent enzyme n=1 Tax=Blastococcus sp. URHD0036 TaxID=1380356 RepID=UPI000497294C|nr:maleylpyruvate isomerase family mycothiol-dependent enzyme [Blastococcus sp. URHD0036]